MGVSAFSPVSHSLTHTCAPSPFAAGSAWLTVPSEEASTRPQKGPGHTEAPTLKNESPKPPRFPTSPGVRAVAAWESPGVTAEVQTNQEAGEKRAPLSRLPRLP